MYSAHLFPLCEVCSPLPQLVCVLLVSLLQLVVLLLSEHHLLLILGGEGEGEGEGRGREGRGGERRGEEGRGGERMRLSISISNWADSEAQLDYNNYNYNIDMH